MPSRITKRTKRATKAQTAKTRSKINDHLAVGGSSTFDVKDKTIPDQEIDVSTHSIAPSTAPTEYTMHSTSPDQHKHNDLDLDSDYELHAIRKGDANTRDPTELPLIIENAFGSRKILWAKMDTGAEANITTEKLVSKLGLTHLMKPISAAASESFAEIGGKTITIDRKISLSFRAGRKNILCKDVEFWVPRQEGDTDVDGIPDVLLGLDVLLKHHMVMIDTDFINEAEEGLEVLAKKVAEEGGKPAIMLLTKKPQVKVRGK
jgi:hypothetical protein